MAGRRSTPPRLKRRLLEFARVQLVGEVWGFRSSRARVYFELRDARGALPCSMWRSDFEALGVRAGRRDAGRGRRRLRLLPGQRLVLAVVHASRSPSCGSPARATCSSSSSACAGGSHADGLFEPQKRLPRPLLPRTIGVVTGERGKARDDVLAGLRRRGWAGRLVWAFAPVQDRHAAPRIAGALRELAAIPEVEVVIVARGGGSLADLFAFCDEALCRTVALLRVPVISSVGHHTDRTLIDDVAAVCCSTPTHAAEAAVPIDCRAARADLLAAARRLHGPRPPRDRRAGAHARAPGRRARRSTSPASAGTCTSCCASCGPARRRAVADGRARPAVHAARARARASSARAARTGRAARARARAAGAGARRARPPADARARLRAGRGPRRRAGRRRRRPRAPPRERPRCASTTTPSTPRSSDEHPEPSRHVRDRGGPDRGDHPPARLRRGRPARDARRSSRRAATWSSTAPASSTRSARGSRSCGSTSSWRGSRARARRADEHVRPARRPAARGRRLHARGPAGRRLERVRAPRARSCT